MPVAVAVALALVLAQAAPRPAPSHTPVAPVRVTVAPATFANLPRRSVTVTEESGATATYEGVDLDAVLAAAGAPTGTAVGGPALAAVVVVHASDGYRAAFTLPELDPAFTSRVTLLADRRNGAAIPAPLGPYRVVVPDEKRHARWVRGVTSVELVPLL